MKSKVVLWGSNAQDEKILIAVALRAEENKVDIWTFPETLATEDFYQQMMKEWRNGVEFELPEPHTHIERDLSVTEGLLPDDLKPEKTDIVHRAQAEWHFIVLSSKLHQAYENELNDIKERVEKLQDFDQAIWENLVAFWSRLQDQSRERNLFRGHADALRDNTNELFAKMKKLRSKMDEEFDRMSKEAYENLLSALQDIEKRVTEGSRLTVMFEELKKLQRKFRETALNRDHRTKLWDKLNVVFKEVKQKRFGTKMDDSNSHYQRLKRRYDGLMEAIDKMEKSIERDNNDLDFQKHKIATTDGQLEAQIRQAKIVMIEDRVRSKAEKLTEMKATQVDLEKRLELQKERDNRRMVKETVKEKIADEIKTAAAAREEDAEKLEKAADEIAKAKPKKKDDSLASAIGATVGESFENVMDTLKAAAKVIGEKIEDAVEHMKEEYSDKEEEKPQEGADEIIRQEAVTVSVSEEQPLPETEEEPSPETEEMIENAVTEIPTDPVALDKEPASDSATLENEEEPGTEPVNEDFILPETEEDNGIMKEEEPVTVPASKKKKKK